MAKQYQFKRYRQSGKTGGIGDKQFQHSSEELLGELADGWTVEQMTATVTVNGQVYLFVLLSRES